MAEIEDLEKVIAICSNLTMAGLLLPNEMARYMFTLFKYSSDELEKTYQESDVLYKQALEFDATKQKN